RAPWALGAGSLHPNSAMTAFETVIGLEVHAELQTASKMFCGCPVVDLTQAEPNSAACEICAGLPGTLPAINARAVEYAVRVALALHCKVNPTSVFARKNYFYPDLPKGFQISQYETPLASEGWLEVPRRDQAGRLRIRIRRVHLEEDTGKLFHRDGHSLVDYNRSGVPLVEIVTEPDLHSVDDLKAFATELRTVLRHLEVTSADMEKGVIRFEANVSLRPPGTGTLGTRTEIKNLNSFRSMVNAVSAELTRQKGVLSAGGRVTQETLGWDDAAGALVPQRTKEEAHDYRYFPEPDLPPLVIDPAWVERIRAGLPELPEARRGRFLEDYGLAPARVDLLIEDRAVAGFFEEAVAQAAGRVSPDKIANWVLVDLFALLHDAGIPIERSRLGPDALAELAAMVEADEINLSTARTLLQEIFENGGDPRALVADRGLRQIADASRLAPIVDSVLAESPSQVAAYREGKTAVFEWLFGQAMKRAEGRADPHLLRAALEAALRPAEGAGSTPEPSRPRNGG
ncbi:MAG: Asp-tRNA(Asn)/Glu-tRNA(Gln) amidotransferase subunit GatB, partial [Anaerolineales bacterium]